MGRQLLVVFSVIYMTQLEKDAILPPMKPKLYKCLLATCLQDVKLMSLTSYKNSLTTTS